MLFLEIINYALAFFTWLLIGRFFLGLLLPSTHDSFIMRQFTVLTNPISRVTDWLTPKAIADFFHIPIAIFWLICLRAGCAMLIIASIKPD